MPGPLNGLRVIELGAIGPAPFAGGLLADLGADVVRIDRPPPKHASSAFERRDPAHEHSPVPNTYRLWFSLLHGACHFRRGRCGCRILDNR